jgi:hypothetical protein
MKVRASLKKRTPECKIVRRNWEPEDLHAFPCLFRDPQTHAPHHKN